MRKRLIRLAYWLGIVPAPSRAYFVDNTGRLIHRRWFFSGEGHSSTLERPVAHFSSTGQLLVHQA